MIENYNNRLQDLMDSVNILSSNLESIKRILSNFEYDNDSDDDNELIIHTIKEKAINYILKNFDFIKVHDVMKHLSWKWAFSKSDDNIPTINELIDMATRLLNDAWDRETTISTGGFHVDFYKDNQTGYKYLDLKFIISETNTYL